MPVLLQIVKFVNWFGKFVNFGPCLSPSLEFWVWRGRIPASAKPGIYFATVRMPSRSRADRAG